MRKLASIVTISSVTPIENSDRLSVAQMDGKGWRVVVGRDEFKVGDRAVYFEIDSALPSDDQRYAMLHDRCLKRWMRGDTCVMSVVRIKTIKLRGVLSQGFLMPINEFPEANGLEVGDDLTDALHVQHIDDVSRPFIKTVSIDASTKSGFPSFIPKTDEERIQNLVDYFTDPSMRKRVFEVTEKNDGSSMTVFFANKIRPDDPFGVCSRNFEKKLDGDGSFVKFVKDANLQEMISKYCIENDVELAFQGELVGPGINQNRDLYPNYEWHVFRIWDITHQQFIEPAKRREICNKIGLTHVPVIAEEMKVFEKFTNVDDLLLFAEGKTARGNEREGLVFKECSAEPITFKAVSNKYLLKSKD